MKNDQQHRRSKRRLLAACAAAVVGAASMPVWAQTATPSPVGFSIASQPLDAALIEFARVADLQVLYSPDLVRGKRANAVIGLLAPAAALDRLLSGSGLNARTDDGRTFTISADRQTQPTASTNGSVSLDDVIVTGFRASTQRSLALREDYNGIAEFLTLDDMGRAPDHNLADALRRLAGVSAVFDEDEGRFVSIQGLPSEFTQVRFNGIRLPSPGGFSRVQNIEAIPPTAIREVVVFKSLTPDLDGAAIGGLVDYRPISAFDGSGGFRATANIGAGWHSITDVPGGPDNVSPRIDATLRTTFGGQDEFGVVLAAGFYDKNRDQTKSNRRWDYADPSGNPRMNRTESLDYTNTIGRRNYLGRLEYKPNDDFYTAITASHYDYNYDEYRYIQRVRYQNITNVTPTTGQFAQGRGEVQVTTFPGPTTQDIVQWEARWRPTGRSELNVNLAYAYGEAGGDPSFDAAFIQPYTTQLGGAWDRANESWAGAELAQVNLTNLSHLNNVGLYQNSGVWAYSNTDSVTSRADLAVDYAFNQGRAVGWGFQLGGSLESAHAEADSSFQRYTPSSSVRMQDFVVPSDYVTLRSGWIPVFLDVDRMQAFLRDNPTAFVSEAQSNATAAADRNRESDRDFEEDIAAGYAIATWSDQSWDIKAGLRVERSEWSGTTYQRRNGVLSQIRLDGNDLSLLPSATARYRIADNIDIRAAYSRSLALPDPGILVQSATVIDTGAPDISINRANPDIEPRRGESFSASFDYRFGTGTLFSAELFHKTIDNLIVSATTRETNSRGGITTTTQPTNATGGEARGISFTLVDDRLDFLPAPFDGFGFVSNLTLLDTRLDVVMNNGAIRAVDDFVGVADMQFNLAVLYEYGPVQTRLTYNRTGRQRSGIDTADARLDQYRHEFDQIDVQARYRLNDNVTFLVEGRNLNEDNDNNAYSGDLHWDTNDFGHSWWASVLLRY